METQRTGHKTELERWVRSTSDTGTMRLYRRLLRLCVGAFLLAFPTLVLLWKLFPHRLDLGFWVYAGMLGGGLIGFVVALGALLWETMHLHSNMALPLADDPQAIPLLLDRLYTDIAHSSEVRARLALLLPQLQIQDASLLAARHYESLNIYLHKLSQREVESESAFLLGVLEAYSRIGDGRALPDVERIAQGKISSAGITREIREAAERCLPYLEKAAEAQQQRATLLRASAPALVPGILLRPAPFTESLAPSQLLRATHAERTESPSEYCRIR